MREREKERKRDREKERKRDREKERKREREKGSQCLQLTNLPQLILINLI
jgi:hypothetical protein